MTKSIAREKPQLGRRPWMRLAVITVLAIALPACSTLEIAYRMADHLALRYVAGYTKLSNRQKGRLAPKFEARMQEHERNELPLYVALFRDADAFAEDRLTREEVDRLLDELIRLYGLLIEESIPLAVTTLQMLDDRQLDYFQEKLAGNITEDLDTIERDPEARRVQRLENVVEDIENWTGALRDEQVALINLHIVEMRDTYGDWAGYRDYRNRKLLAALRDKVSKQRLSRLLHDGWVTRSLADTATRNAWEENREHYRSMLVALDATLSERQRTKMRRRFTKYANNLANLLPDKNDSRLASIEQ